MKKTIFIALVSIALTVLVMSPGCKKDKCYECEKNVGQTDEAHWDVCGEDQHQQAIDMQYHCTEK